MPPFYEETIHTPLFVWDPRSGVAGESRDALVQTIDFGPTLLDHFGLDTTPDMQGRSLLPALSSERPLHEAALFGLHGGHANVTDGRFVYMRACVTPDNQPLFDYTLMPTSMRGRFGAEALRHAELVAPLPFSKGMPLLAVPAIAPTNPAAFGSQLFDLESDPQQLHPLVDDDLELRMIGLLVELMRQSDAPSEQYERLGVPESGAPGAEHLVLARQQAQGAARPTGGADLSVLADSAVAMRSVRELLADERARAVLRDELGPLVDGPLPEEAMGMSLLQIATVTADLVPHEALHRIAARL